MSIICEHVHRLELWNFCLNFRLLWQRSKCTGNPVYRFFVCFSFRHTCLKLNIILISSLTGKCATKIIKKTNEILSMDMFTYYAYQGAK